MKDLAAITDRLKLLGDPTRLRVLHLLELEELTVGELASILSQGQSTVSAHLARLREASLVLDRRAGTRSYYRLNALGLDDSERSIWQLCAGKLLEDPILGADRDRMEQVVLARQAGSWVDRAAGSLDRRYVPGRSFESLSSAFSCLLDLGDCVDMGSGDGALLDFIVPATRSLVCLDQHPGMVESGQKRIAAGKFQTAKFMLGDMHDPPLEDSSVDTVLFVQSLQYAKKPAVAVRSASRILRRGGRCLVLTLASHKDQRIQREYGHEHAGFAPAKLRRFFEDAGLTVQRCERVGQDTRSPQLPILLGLAVLDRGAAGR